MKIIVIISAICVCVGALTHEELKSEIHILQSICKTEIGIDQQIIDDINDGKINIDDENVLLFVECTMKKFNIVDENGNFKEKDTRDVVGAVLNEDEVNQLITECSPISDTNVHVKISKILQCFAKYKTINDVLNS
ncbi:uncharacterized protein LOC122713731 [Apis laboriosa]|uniref:uncharacterized protein LOC122713731 n=1 Tax=Apis laboriosa TaxID=183418 RepID=UPI001CC3B34D|nr:uncharacterized protein LOC122713731 [Apis laboriosa]